MRYGVESPNIINRIHHLILQHLFLDDEEPCLRRLQVTYLRDVVLENKEQKTNDCLLFIPYFLKLTH